MDLVDVDAVVADLTVGDVVEAVDQVRDRRLAGARGAHEGDLLAGLCPQGDVVQDLLLSVVGEVDILHDQFATQARVGDGAVSLVRVAPGPDSRAFLGRLESAVGQLARTHEGHVALVLLGLLVDEGKHAARTRHTHGDHGDLHGHLADRLREVTDHAQEGHDHADRDDVDAEEVDIRRLLQDHDAANDRDDHVHDVANVAQGGHQHVAVDVGLLRGFEELVVVLDELVLGVLLVVEDLDNLLAVHHLFDEAFFVGESGLLSLHEATRQPAELSG